MLLNEGLVPTALKNAVAWPLPKKQIHSTLDPIVYDFCLITNIPVLWKLLEKVVVDQQQALLEATDYLDPCQSGSNLALTSNQSWSPSWITFIEKWSGGM